MRIWFVNHTEITWRLYLRKWVRISAVASISSSCLCWPIFNSGSTPTQTSQILKISPCLTCWRGLPNVRKEDFSQPWHPEKVLPQHASVEKLVSQQKYMTELFIVVIDGYFFLFLITCLAFNNKEANKFCD